MELRPADRLMLLMLSEIYEHLGIAGEVNPKFIKEVLFGGHLWALKWEMPGIFEVEDDTEQTVREVTDILEMFSWLESSFEELSDDDKAKVTAQHRLRFRGFDGNHETAHMSIARFFVEHMGRWTEFAGRDFNSHSPMVERSLRMVAKHRELMDAKGVSAELFSAEEVQQVLDA